MTAQGHSDLVVEAENLTDDTLRNKRYDGYKMIIKRNYISEHSNKFLIEFR